MDLRIALNLCVNIIYGRSTLGPCTRLSKLFHVIVTSQEWQTRDHSRLLTSLNLVLVASVQSMSSEMP